MKWMVETDIIFSAIYREDPNHNLSREVLKGLRRVALSPYSLMELDLLIRSGNLEVESYEEFWSSFGEFLSQYGVKLIPSKPSHFLEAEVVRKTHGLSYLDSLHAAAAIHEGATLISYDESYSRVGGLRHIHPKEL